MSGAIQDLGLCSRCKTERAVTVSRKEEFCKVCFIRFISGKQRKQMSSDRYKVKFGDDVVKEKVLVPLSYGSSSLVLFDILISLFDEQTKNERAKLGFEIDLIHVDDSKVLKYENSYKDVIKQIKTQYDLKDYPIKFTKLDIDSFINDKDSMNNITLLKDFTTYKYKEGKETTIEDIFASLPNRASRSDLFQIILNDLISKYAFAHDFQSIIWGHNMTTLAQEVITLTVKGRGSEIYSKLSDGIACYKGKEIEHIHPLRDVSKGEIDTFVKLRSLEQYELKSAEDSDKLMNKQKTINEVVSNYYKVVDQDYDNIVSTVVKTGSKLDEPKNFDEDYCTVCRGKIYNKPMEWLKDITYHGDRGPENEIEEESLREWTQANKDSIDRFEKADKEQVSLCYGCAVTIGGVNNGTISWPVKTSTQSKVDILNEFIICDDDEDE